MVRRAFKVLPDLRGSVCKVRKVRKGFRARRGLLVRRAFREASGRKVPRVCKA